MNITDENMVQIWLKAREASEAAHVCVFTSPQDGMYDDRAERVRERLADLLSVIEISNTKSVIEEAIEFLGGVDGAVEIRSKLIKAIEP